MTATIVPKRANFVAEVIGYEVGLLIEPEDNVVRGAVEEYSVVVIRGLDLCPAEQIELTRLLGQPERVWDVLNRHPEHPDIQIISNQGRTPAVGAELWHTDRSFEVEPTRHTLLHARVLPKKRIDTLFADMVAAYHQLSDNVKSVLNGAVGIHSYEKVGRLRRAVHGAELERNYAFPPARHPIVRAHPDTGQRALYVNELCLQGVESIRGDPIGISVDELHRHATRASLVYSHEWLPGDVVIWDNMRVMHRATPDPFAQLRVMHRSTTTGDKPVPAHLPETVQV
jgi:taurine dioxygenase